MINILFCGNQFDGMLTTMLSILKRTETTDPFTFYAYSMDCTDLNPKFVALSDEEAEFLQNVAKEYNEENKFIKIDVKEIYNKEFAGGINEPSGYTPYAAIRLFADLVEGMPEKLLYLDTDVLLNRDIKLLYDIDIDGYEYAAARDHYGKYFINPNYINSGVMLLNLSEIRKTGLFEKARKTFMSKKLLFPDQSAIRVNTSKKKMLSVKFNDQKFLHKNTVVRHFSKRLFWLPYPHTDNIKQWNVSKVHKVFKYYEFDDILYEYIYLKKLFENKIKGK